MTRITAATVCLLAVLLASGCIRVYRIDVQQGNDLTPKQVEALEVGMNRQQVRALLGTPLVDDPFRQDRWDYFYTFKGGREKEVARRRISLFFDGETLARIEGDLEEETVPATYVDLDELPRGDLAPADSTEEADRPGFWQRLGQRFGNDEAAGQAE